MLTDLSPDPRIVIPRAAVAFRAVRASGPGGQHVNKTATKVVMSVDLDAIVGINHDERTRLRDLVPRHQCDADGHLVLSSQLTRDRVRNQRDVELKLRQLLIRAIAMAPARKAPLPNRDVERRRLREKKARAQRLVSRRVPDERAWD